MQVVKFPDDFYDEGVVKFAKGQYYPLNSETQSLVNSGHAELLDPEHMQQDVEALKALAKLARDRADSCAAWAQALAEEADEAERLAAAAEAGKKEPAGDPAVQTSAPKKPDAAHGKKTEVPAAAAEAGKKEPAGDPAVQTSAPKKPDAAHGKKTEVPAAVVGDGQPPAETGNTETSTQTTETP